MSSTKNKQFISKILSKVATRVSFLIKIMFFPELDLSYCDLDDCDIANLGKCIKAKPKKV